MAARISSRSGRYCACRSSNGTFIRLLYPLPPSHFVLRRGRPAFALRATARQARLRTSCYGAAGTAFALCATTRQARDETRKQRTARFFAVFAVFAVLAVLPLFVDF